MSQSSKKKGKKRAERPSSTAQLALLSLNQHILQRALAEESDPAQHAHYEREAAKVDEEIGKINRSNTRSRVTGERRRRRKESKPDSHASGKAEVLKVEGGAVRFFKRQPFTDRYLVEKIKEVRTRVAYPPVIQTWSRHSTITPEFVGLTFAIRSGKRHIPVYVTENMVGRKLGEFAPARGGKRRAEAKPTKTKVRDDR